MIIRRALFFAQFGAAVVLPLWIFIARGIVNDGLGWDIVSYLFVCPALFVIMMVIAVLNYARKSVRASKQLSWLGAGIQLALYSVLIVAGFVTSPVVVALVAIIVVGAFWVAVWELVTETRSRFRGFVDELGRVSAQPETTVRGDAEIFVIKPSDPTAR